MELLPSAHVDTFCRDNLPPADQWPDLVFDLPELSYPDRLNCAQALLAFADRTPDAPCLHEPGAPSWTYRELAVNSRKVAQLLTRRHHIVPGNRVLLRGPNNRWLTAAWLGAVLAGAVVVTTMHLLREGEIATIDEIAHLDLALVDHRYTDGMPPGITTVPYGDDAWDAEMAALDGRFEPVATSSDDVVMLAFTSGTTGRPKATMHFHRDVMAICDTFCRQVLRPSASDVFIGTPPYAFTFGLGGDLLFPLSVGASTVLVEKATPLQLADLIDEHHATICFTAPTAYKAMIQAQRTMPSLRGGVSAGEHLPQATWEAFRDLTGVELIDGIGSTEMLHIFISAAGKDIHPGSTGTAIPGYQARIVDDAGNPVPPGSPGHLAVKGPTGCRYLADPRQKKYVQNGWNLTGDTFIEDEDGYFWYRARSDDMIVSSGYNIAAPEVEEALMRHEAVAECAVVGTPDQARGSLVTAYVVLVDGVTGDDGLVRRLQDFTKAQIAPYKYPRVVRFVDELPRTNTGKLQRFRLRSPGSH